MWMLIYNILKDFGAFGIGIVQFGVILYGGYKLFTNHLHHLQKGINESNKELKVVKEEVMNLKERVSRIEGRIL